MNLDRSDRPLGLPNDIIYDTCCGYANFDEPGRIMKDSHPSKGRNEYITVLEINGKPRKYLTHTQVVDEKLEKEAEKVFSSMDSGVYGVVAHSIELNTVTGRREARSLVAFLDFLHKKNPRGEKSRTVSEIMVQNLLPEVKLDEKLIHPGKDKHRLFNDEKTK